MTVLYLRHDFITTIIIVLISDPYFDRKCWNCRVSTHRLNSFFQILLFHNAYCYYQLSTLWYPCWYTTRYQAFQPMREMYCTRKMVRMEYRIYSSNLDKLKFPVFKIIAKKKTLGGGRNPMHLPRVNTPLLIINRYSYTFVNYTYSEYAACNL